MSCYQPDEILSERDFLGAADLAAAGFEATDQTLSDGSPLFRWPAKAAAVELPCPFDFSEHDEIAIPCVVPEDAGLRLSLTVNLDSSTPGVAGKDSCYDWASLGKEAREPRFGEQEARFCLEDFHFYGLPLTWHNATGLSIIGGADSGVLIGPWLLRKRRRPRGPRLSDDAFFEQLDLSRPGLEAVTSAVEKKSPPAAARALSDYYRSRAEPRHIYPRKTPAPSPAALEQLQRNEILNYSCGEAIDWRANPFGYLEWRHAFNRHTYLRTMLAAYLDSGREELAGKLDEWLRGWISASPCPVRTSGGGDPAWETLSVAVRIYGSWLDVFFGTLRSGNFTDVARLGMLKSIFAHAEHLLHHSVVGGNNWLVVESRALATIGMLFPEFKAADTWRREGLDRLAAEVERQIYPDGADWELSPGYHAMAVRGFAEPMQIAEMNGIRLPQVYRERVRGALDFSAAITRPDGTVPAPNDSGAFDGRHDQWLQYGADLFDDDALRWGASRGEKGHRPDYTSRAFDDAGYYVMRDSWDADARWMFFDGGPLGYSHVHEDKLSFELAAFGKLFIVDPGIASYQRDAWTSFYRSPSAHNTILIDGQGQSRKNSQDKETQCRSVRGENLWASGSTLDAVCAEYRAAFGSLEERFLHRRRAIFLKPDYWLLLDEIEGPGEHEIETLFHFAPMQVATDVEGRVRSERLELPNLEIVPVFPGEPAEPRLICGARDPVQGWVVSGRGSRNRENLPAPTAVYRTQTGLPWRSAWLLVPFRDRPSAQLKITALPAPADCMAFAVLHPDGRRDTIALRFGDWTSTGDSWTFGEYTTDAWAAIARSGTDGRLASAAAVAGTLLKGPDADLSGPDATVLLETRS